MSQSRVHMCKKFESNKCSLMDVSPIMKIYRDHHFDTMIEASY